MIHAHDYLLSEILLLLVSLDFYPFTQFILTSSCSVILHRNRTCSKCASLSYGVNKRSRGTDLISIVFFCSPLLWLCDHFFLSSVLTRRSLSFEDLLLRYSRDFYRTWKERNDSWMEHLYGSCLAHVGHRSKK